MDGVARFFAVVEMNRLVAEDLIRFMALAGDDDDVIGLSQFDSAINGIAAVNDNFVMLARFQAFFDAGFDFGNDGFRVFLLWTAVRVISSPFPRFGRNPLLPRSEKYA